VFKGHSDTIKGIAFPPNGRYLVSGSDDQSVRIWNLRDGSSKIMPVTGRTSFFLSVAFSQDGRYIAGGNLNNSLCIWDSRRQKLVAKWPGHSSGVWCVEFTPDGKGLISGGGNGMVKYWDMASLGSGSEWQSFVEIRRFSGHSVRLFCVFF
jgi:WD40 repeat protein